MGRRCLITCSLLIEALFWSVLGHLQHASPDFAAGRGGKVLLRRFKARVHSVDSAVIHPVANCMDWAKHRRRKVAAKIHLRLDLHSFLPPFAIVDIAAHHDNKHAREIRAGVAAGEIVVFDKAYVDFEHLADLDARGVWWVIRAKEQHGRARHISEISTAVQKTAIAHGPNRHPSLLESRLRSPHAVAVGRL